MQTAGLNAGRWRAELVKRGSQDAADLEELVGRPVGEDGGYKTAKEQVSVLSCL